jgi:hypothetical protein
LRPVKLAFARRIAGVAGWRRAFVTISLALCFGTDEAALARAAGLGV